MRRSECGRRRGQLLREAALAVEPGSIPAREARAWLVGWQGIRGVLRCRPVSSDAAARVRLLDDVAWLHVFLAGLAARQRPRRDTARRRAGHLAVRQLAAACPDSDRAAVIRCLAARLTADLDGLGHPAAGWLVIHGDFTNHNVVADGIPPRPVGVIDFERVHLEVPLADIGYGLWRSGRPRQDAGHLDLARLRRFVRGYASTAVTWRTR